MTGPVTTVEDSRTWRGSLKLTAAGGTAKEFACQFTNTAVTADYDNDGDNESTLCGRTLGAPRKSNGYRLKGTFICDQNRRDGLNAFTYDHELEPVGFVFMPSDAEESPTIKGTAIVEMADFGGDVRTRNKIDIEWMLTERPVIEWVVLRAAESAESAESDAPATDVDVDQGAAAAVDA